MLDSSRFLAKVASIVGSDLQLETLPIPPIIVVTEDLVTKRQVAISEGDFFTVLQLVTPFLYISLPLNIVGTY